MGPGTIEPYIRGYREEGANDLIVTMRRVGKKQKDHVAFKENVPEYVSQTKELDDLATEIGIAGEEAIGEDKFKVAKLKDLIGRGVQALDNNADHVIKVARHRNDPSILLEAGYDLKPDTITVKEKINLLDLVPEISVKHVPHVSGAIVVILKLAMAKAIVELQITVTPDVEDSWKGVGEGTFNKCRVEIRGLQPAKTVYLRARYHKDGGVGHWCTPVTLIVL